MIRPEKRLALEQKMLALGLLEKDLLEKFILGSGKGGQKINKTHNCVYLKHEPSGISLKCQMDRQREINRFLARRELCEVYEQVLLGKRSVKSQAIEKMRRQKQRKNRKQKAKAQSSLNPTENTTAAGLEE